MKEIQNILKLYENLETKSGQCAMATVVYVEGSSYRRPGARMLITSNGRWVGGISGGCLEGDALKKAQNVIHTGRPRVVTYDNREEDPFQLGVSLGCKGLISILVELVTEEHINQLSQIVRSRKPSIIAHLISDNESANLGAKAYWRDGQIIQNEINESMISEVESAFQQIASNEVGEIREINSIRISFEYILPNKRLIAIGGSYDAYPMISTAASLGWEVHMMANQSKMRKEAFSICAKTWNEKTTKPVELIEYIDSYTAILLMNHDIDRDRKWLEVVLPSEAFYIGMLGPRIRAVELLNEMKIDAAQFANLRFPIGIDIGAQCPEEIALSVLSEIIAIQNKRDAGFLKLRKSPIYDNPR